MELGKIKGFGELLTAFRSKDKDNSGLIEVSEDKDILKLDQDGDQKVALWEVIEAVNKQKGKPIFSTQAVIVAKNWPTLMTNVSSANIAQFVFMIEAKHVELASMQAAFKNLNAVMARMKKEDFSGLEPPAKLQRAKAIIKEEGYVLYQGETPSTFVFRMANKKLRLTEMHWLMLAVGRELKWPVSLAAYNSQYQYIKWEDQGAKFNYLCTLGPNGGTITDNDLKARAHMSEASLRAGVFLKSLSEVEFLGTVYANLAGVFRAGNCEDFACDKPVTEATDKAMAYNPKNIDALTYRAQTLFAGSYLEASVLNYPGPDGRMINGVNRNREAIRYYDRAIKLDPNQPTSYLIQAQMIAHGLFDCKTAEKVYARGVALIKKFDPETLDPEEKKLFDDKVAETRKVLDQHRQDCVDREEGDKMFKPSTRGTWDFDPPPPGFFREMMERRQAKEKK